LEAVGAADVATVVPDPVAVNSGRGVITFGAVWAKGNAGADGMHGKPLAR
jgi:hypothetical protein